MMRAHIIYYNYLKPEGVGMSIGGIQTYITNLMPVLRACGYTVTIYQRSYEDFHHEFDGFEVYGIGHKLNYGPLLAKALLEKAIPLIDVSCDLLVYGCESCITRKMPCRTIAIQHGISWDVPKEGCSSWMYLRRYVGKSRMAWKTIQRVSKVDQLVCVDYNFVNWHRAVSPYPKVKHIVIPNFTDIPTSQPQKENDTLHIIFARRFFVHRGTRLFTHVAEKILSEYDKVYITIAGAGPDADYMHGRLDLFDRVQFIAFDSLESLNIHRDKDIAVVPTIGSEGTSLSLLEAMASGCATICTNVGGMTNIILDGYNGVMISPEESDLYNALKMLIDNPSVRKELQNHAYETVRLAFSLDIWKERWMKVIKEERQ